MFDTKQYDKGTVISTPTSGILRLTLIISGQVGLFLHKKVKEDYLIFAVLGSSQVFNENKQMFQQQNNYGVLVLQDNTQVLTLKTD